MKSNGDQLVNKISSVKMPPKKVTRKKKVSTKTSSTQVENPSLFGWKEALEKVAKINLNSFTNNDQELDKINDFCEKLKTIISEEQIILLKKKQLKTELQVDLVIKFAIEYLHRYKVVGFADFLHRISEQIGNYVYELSTEKISVQLTCPKKWMDLNQVLEICESAKN